MEASLFTKVSTQDIAHQSMIHDTQYDYYGKKLATCSSDGFVRFFDVQQPDKMVATGVEIKAHNGPCWQIAWAHPSFGSIIATCGFDNKVKIFKEEQKDNWSMINCNEQHKGSVNSISFAPWECGLVLAAGSSDGRVSVWKYSIANTLWSDPVIWEGHGMGINAVSWEHFTSFDENDILHDKFKKLSLLATGSSDGSIYIWKENQSKLFDRVYTFEQLHSDWVRDVAWCPAFGNPEKVLASCGEDGKAFIIKFKEQQESEQIPPQELEGTDGPVWRLSWSLNGNMLAITTATPSSDNKVIVYQENEDGQYQAISTILEQMQE